MYVHINFIGTTTAATVPTNKDLNCPNCLSSVVLASVVSVVSTALLCTAVFILVQVALWKCRVQADGEAREGGQDDYEQVDGEGRNDPTYMDIQGGGGGGNSFQMKGNEAYANTVDLKTNTAYAAVAK